MAGRFGVWGGGGWGAHFHVQPNYSVEVVLRLCCAVIGVGVVTINVPN